VDLNEQPDRRMDTSFQIAVVQLKLLKVWKIEVRLKDWQFMDGLVAQTYKRSIQDFHAPKQ
jgi:hypothetical protein